MKAGVPRTLALATAAASLASVLAGAGLGRLGRVEVVGASMLPTLEPGDRLVYLRTRAVGPGRLAVVRDPRQRDRLLVKRVVRRAAGGVEVAGDNPAASTDSRHFGLVADGLLVGRVLYRYAPLERAGRA